MVTEKLHIVLYLEPTFSIIPLKIYTVRNFKFRWDHIRSFSTLNDICNLIVADPKINCSLQIIRCLRLTCRQLHNIQGFIIL